MDFAPTDTGQKREATINPFWFAESQIVVALIESAYQ